MKKTFSLLLILILSQISTGKSVNSRMDGLVFLWHMNDGTGTDVRDEKETYYGAIQGGVAWVNGKYGWALNFDGTDGYITTTTPGLTGTLTLEAWIYFDKLADIDGVRLWCNSWSGAEAKGFDQYFTGDGGMIIWINGSPTDTSDTQVVVVEAGRWNYVAITYDDAADEVIFYINETFEVTANDGAMAAPALDFYLGARQGPGSYFKGMVDEVAIYNRVLTRGELMQHREEGKGKFIN